MSERIAVVEDVWGAAFDELETRRDVLVDPEAWADPARLSEIAAASAVLVVRNRTQVTRELLERSPGLRLIARAGVGLDNIDLEAADELGVVVVAGLGANAASVAEHALGLALATARRTLPLDAEVREGGWNRAPGRELAGGTWGLLSAGATARATARLARGIGMEVVAFDPYVNPADPGLAELGIRLVECEEVAALADVLSVHLPATPATRNIVDAGFLARMKPHAILINCGRGEVIDESALADALSAGRILGAGLDVRQQEPTPAPDPLARYENVVLTPHIAGITEQAQARIMRILCRDIDAVLDGRPTEAHVGRRSAPERGAEG